ncbi:hypothetical protein OROHE_023810 [Orobanche hederae]
MRTSPWWYLKVQPPLPTKLRLFFSIGITQEFKAMPVYQDRLPRFAADGGIWWSWWRKLSKRERTIAAAAVATLPLFVFLFVFSPISISRKFTNTNSNTNAGLASEWVPFTALSKAKENSASFFRTTHGSLLCLDGSVPGYHLRRGFGSGSDSWILHIEELSNRNTVFINMYYLKKFTISYDVAFKIYVKLSVEGTITKSFMDTTPAGSSIAKFFGGGWCSTVSSCSARKRTKLGSSTHMEQQVQFFGILSHDPFQNPDFFNWNKLQNGTKMFFRGQLIWKTLMDELLSIGMSKARELADDHSSIERTLDSHALQISQALLTGCSAGGLATLIHCDDFGYLLPKDANVKCLADAGFFLNEKDIVGNHTIESFYRDVVHLQSVAKSLNHDCVAKSEPSKCFFPQEFIRNIKTPLFLVQPAYDFWQIANILVPGSSDPHDSWLRCKLNIFNCDTKQLEVLQGYRNSLLKTLSEIRGNLKVGVFINSCFVHCQTWAAETWHSPTSPRINNKTVAETVGGWYFEREAAEHIDCPFPCNPTCYHRDLTFRVLVADVTTYVINSSIAVLFINYGLWSGGSCIVAGGKSHLLM